MKLTLFRACIVLLQTPCLPLLHNSAAGTFSRTYVHAKPGILRTAPEPLCGRHNLTDNLTALQCHKSTCDLQPTVVVQTPKSIRGLLSPSLVLNGRIPCRTLLAAAHTCDPVRPLPTTTSCPFRSSSPAESGRAWVRREGGSERSRRRNAGPPNNRQWSEC